MLNSKTASSPSPRASPSEILKIATLMVWTKVYSSWRLRGANGMSALALLATTRHRHETMSPSWPA